MRTIIYIDGFNLYYRMLKARPDWKWLNPKLLAEQVLNPGHVITRVNYYTARLSSEIAVHEGNFMTSEPWMPLASPARAKPDGYQWNVPAPHVVKVVKYEEKGSDVNLGAHLVRDAFTNSFDVAVVLTNDSDLVEPIRIATREAGKRIGLLVPVRYPTQSLIAAASFHLHIRAGHLARAQFAAQLHAPDGSIIARPASWI